MKGKLSFIGSGNTAWQLAHAFDLAGYQIHQVISRNAETGKKLAGKFGAYFQSDVSALYADADFVFLTLPDLQIEPVAKSIATTGPVFLHCAGSIPLSSLSDHKPESAVFYPLQTFSSGRTVNFFDVPVFVEANDTSILQKVMTLADSVSNRVHILDSDKRRKLHLAAVMVNNFTNFLLTQANGYMKENELPFEWLQPLIRETIQKAFDLGPENSQTGPARRGDTLTIDKHLQMLENQPELREIYSLLSHYISRAYGKE